MGICNKFNVLRTISVLSGLGAFALLAVSLLMYDWILIHYRDRTTRAYDVPDEGSGEVAFTTAGTRNRPVAYNYNGYYRHRFFRVGAFSLCANEEWVPQMVNANDFLGYNPWYHRGENSKCWVIYPSRNDWVPNPEDDETWKLSFLSDITDIPHKPSVQWPMLACAAGTVLALLVTSVGMAMNNSIVVGGGALYLFSGLVLVIATLEFYTLTQYSKLEDSLWSYKLYQRYKPNVMEISNGDWMDSPYHTEVVHMIGPGVYFIVGVFVLLCLAAATAVVHFRVSPNQATKRKLIRKEREAIAHAPPRTEMVRIVTKM